MADYSRAAPTDPTTAVGVVSSPWSGGYQAISDRVGGAYSREDSSFLADTPNRSMPLPKTKGNCELFSSYLSATPTPEEGGSVLRDDDYILQSSDVPVRELTEEEQLAQALKASIDIALEEQAARVASFLFNRGPGSSVTV